jgi:hypothetical protein
MCDMLSVTGRFVSIVILIDICPLLLLPAVILLLDCVTYVIAPSYYVPLQCVTCYLSQCAVLVLLY